MLPRPPSGPRSPTSPNRGQVFAEKPKEARELIRLRGEPHDVDSMVEEIHENTPGMEQMHLASKGINNAQCLLIFHALKSNSTLKVMDLANNSITHVGVEGIVECLRLNTTLTELNLHNNRIGEIGAKMLFEALKTNQSVRKLHLDLNGIPGRALEAVTIQTELNSQPLTFKRAYPQLQSNELTSLDLSEHANEPFDCSMLVAALRGNTALEELNLANIGMGDKGGETIGRMLFRNKALKRISLANNDIGPQGMADLGEGLTENAVVEWLCLEGNRAGDDGARALIQSMNRNDTVTHINLSQNRVSPKLLKDLKATVELNTHPLRLKQTRLAAFEGRAEESIDFSDHGQLRDSAKVLAPALKKNTKTTRLCLSNNRCGDSGLKDIVEVLRVNRTLKTLDLANNEITMVGAKVLSEVLQENETVTEISLTNNSIGTEGARLLLDCLSNWNHSVTELHLELNNIDPVVMDEVEEAVQMNREPITLKKTLPRIYANDRKLTTVDFSEFDGRYLTDQAAKHLSRALKSNHIVTEVILTNNGVGNAGMLALANTLKLNTTLTSMDVSYNSLGDRGAIALAEGLMVNTSLATLRLDYNIISDSGAEALIEMLGTNHALKVLSCERNRITPAKMQLIQATCDVNSTNKALKDLVPSIQRNDAEAVRRLRLSHGEYDDKAVGVLCSELSTATNCKRINLAYNNLNLEGVSKVIELLNTNKSVKKVDLSSNNVGDEGASLIAEFLTGNSSLQKLGLSSCGIGPEGAHALLGALEVNRTIKFIRLTGNDIPTDVMDALDDALGRNRQHKSIQALLPRIAEDDPSLVKINLSDASEKGFKCDAVTARLIAVAMLTNTTLTKINLASNNVGPQGAQYLADMLEENSTLTSLNLNDNGIGDEGGQALAAALKEHNDELQQLWAEGNGISEKVMQEIGSALQINTAPPPLKGLLNKLEGDDPEVSEVSHEGGLTGRKCGDDGFKLICLALQSNRHVRRLMMGHNDLTDASVHHLVPLLRCNSTLTEVDLSHNQLGAGAGELARAMMSNTSVMAINLKGNPAIPGPVLDEVAIALSINTSTYSSPLGRIPNPGDEVPEETFTSLEYVSAIEASLTEDARIPPINTLRLMPKGDE